MPNLTNPLKADLDGGGHNITNVANFQSAGGAQIGGQFGTGVLWFKHGPAPTDWRAL